MGGKYYNISELAQILNLKDPKTGKEEGLKLKEI